MCIRDRRHTDLYLRHPDALDVLPRPGEGYLEVARIGAKDRLIQAVIEHLVPHPAKAASALLDPVEIRQTLGKNRVARAWAVSPAPQTGQRDRPRRKTGTQNRHPIGEDLQDDLAAGVLVLAMGDRIHKRLTQTVHRILVEPKTVETDNTHRMAGVAVDELERPFDCQGHGRADVFVIPRVAVRLRAAIGIGEDAALRKNHRRIPAKEDYAGCSGVILAGTRVMPDQPARQGA